MKDIEQVREYWIAKYINYQYKLVWYFQWMPKPLFRWLEKHLGWHTMVVAVPKE